MSLCGIRLRYIQYTPKAHAGCQGLLRLDIFMINCKPLGDAYQVATLQMYHRFSKAFRVDFIRDSTADVTHGSEKQSKCL